MIITVIFQKERREKYAEKHKKHVLRAAGPLLTSITSVIELIEIKQRIHIQLTMRWEYGFCYTWKEKRKKKKKKPCQLFQRPSSGKSMLKTLRRRRCRRRRIRRSQSLENRQKATKGKSSRSRREKRNVSRELRDDRWIWRRKKECVRARESE